MFSAISKFLTIQIVAHLLNTTIEPVTSGGHSMLPEIFQRFVSAEICCEVHVVIGDVSFKRLGCFREMAYTVYVMDGTVNT